MVWDLDLSYFYKENLDPEGMVVPTAGWREFKYRALKDCHVKDFLTVQKREDRRVSSHPAPSLRGYSHTRDVSIGGLVHVLAACKKLR